MRILIAEDDLDISNLYKKALEKNRHQVVLTSNGSDCLTNYLTTLSSMASKPIQQSKEDANKRSIRSLDNSSAKPMM